ncbi:hypothetical protein [Stenotrophomonas sp. CC120223-11]|uniref:hypothetical protein n=1 Tax=Stenotrophomonas sp. CC120223-11 TaxID=1378090 RepID=UPI000BE32707|nr:hypothetical protein [Stenotrophomonas sp. CC120223-11]
MATLVPLLACAAGPLEGDYRRASVQPVEVTVLGANQIKIRYSTPGETLFHSPGVDYRSADGTLQVAIRRCGIKDSGCTVTAKATSAKDDPWRPVVVLPYRGEKIMMMYSDGQQQIVPAAM